MHLLASRIYCDYHPVARTEHTSRKMVTFLKMNKSLFVSDFYY